MTKQTKKVICWTKWVDPLNRNIDEVEYPGYDLQGGDNDVEVLSQEGMEDEDEDVDKNTFHKIEPVRIISTPHGLMTLTEHSFASATFDFWTMHCNFNVTPEIAKAIEEAPGVESFNVVTRNRARIGINRFLLKSGAFNLNEVRQGVENAVFALDNKNNELLITEKLLLFQPDIRLKAQEVMQKLSDSKYWGIYVFPNGEIETFSAPEKIEKLEDKLTLFYVLQDLVGGVVLSSEEK
jgi:hypothetical protein